MERGGYPELHYGRLRSTRALTGRTNTHASPGEGFFTSKETLATGDPDVGKNREVLTEISSTKRLHPPFLEFNLRNSDQ